jgi:hypothetical protein
MTDFSISRKHSMDYVTLWMALSLELDTQREGTGIWYYKTKMKKNQNQKSHQDRDKGVQANESDIYMSNQRKNSQTPYLLLLR